MKVWKRHCNKIRYELVVPPQSPEASHEADPFAYTNEMECAQCEVAAMTDQHKGVDLDTIKLVRLLEALNKGRPKRTVVERVCGPAPHVSSVSTTQGSKNRLVLLPANETILLAKGGDNVYLGSIQLSQQVEDILRVQHLVHFVPKLQLT